MSYAGPTNVLGGDAGRRLAFELTRQAIGTLLLLAVVIGSGIMAERLADGNVAIALLANTLAAVSGLCILIEVFGPMSGAHFKPGGERRDGAARRGREVTCRSRRHRGPAAGHSACARRTCGGDGVTYIGAAYWFTASTSFANPAAVLGRTLSNSFVGIAPASAPGSSSPS